MLKLEQVNKYIRICGLHMGEKSYASNAKLFQDEFATERRWYDACAATRRKIDDGTLEKDDQQGKVSYIFSIFRKRVEGARDEAEHAEQYVTDVDLPEFDEVEEPEED